MTKAVLITMLFSPISSTAGSYLLVGIVCAAVLQIVGAAHRAVVKWKLEVFASGVGGCNDGKNDVAVTRNKQLVNGAVSGRDWKSLEDMYRYTNVFMNTEFI